MKWFERNSIWIAFGFMAVCILFQTWYITKIKSELKLFANKEHTIIAYVELHGQKYTTLTDTIKVKCNDTTSNAIIRKQYSERGALKW